MQITIKQQGRYNQVNEAGLMRAKRCSPGDVIDVPDWYAQALIDHGFAKAVAEEPVEEASREEVVLAADHPFLDIEGVGLQAAHALLAAGYQSLADLAHASDEQLLAIEHIGRATLRRIRHYVTAVHAGE